MAKPPIHDTFWRELERLSRALGQVGPDEVCCAELTVRQCGILRRLVESEGARLGDLAESVGITPSAMTRVLEKLEQRGLVQRVRGAQQDGRAAMVAITPAGRQVRTDIDRLMLERTRAIVSAIPAPVRGEVLAALQTLNRALERAGACCTFNAPARGAAELVNLPSPKSIKP
jgi:DNA-binding MarR family transcriptional regulator